MKNNNYDGLNYEKPKYKPVDDFTKWYEENGKSKPNNEAASDSVEALRQQYEEDPSSLNSIQLLTLGMAELNVKNEAESQETQKKANEYHKEDEEMVSTESEEYQQLTRNIEEMNRVIAELKGGGGE